MISSQSVNTNNPAVKRILREAREMSEAGPNPDFDARPLEDNLFEWHFTIRGPPGTAFEGGRYHGRICLPNDYPFKPPSIVLLNASGRFEVGKKICLSVSAHHPEHWQPAWGIRTIITALIAFFPSKADGALAGLDYSDGERRKLAASSRSWHCPRCELAMMDALPDDDGSHSGTSLPPPPPELTFAHEAPRKPADGTSPDAASPPTHTLTSSADTSTAAAPSGAESLGGDGGDGSAQLPICDVCTTAVEHDGTSDVHDSPPSLAPGPASASDLQTTSNASSSMAGDVARADSSTVDSARPAPRPAPPTATSHQIDWLGYLAACIAGLIAMLLTRKLSEDDA